MILVNYFVFCSVVYISLATKLMIDIKKHNHWKLLENEKCGISNSDRIIGGKNASLGMYPWIARIGYFNFDYSLISFRCGGSLINSRYVVTAAHCLTDLDEGIAVALVRLGEHFTETDPDCEDDYCAQPVQDFEPQKIIPHKNYNNNYKNDIGLIRLAKPVKYNEFILPICMPTGELLKKKFIGEKAEVAGWGIYDINDPKASTILQTVKLPIVSLQTCRIVFRKTLTIGQEQLCAGGVVGEDSCGGDSGGPLMKVESLDGPPKYYFIGLVSFGAQKCGLEATPGVYTKISYYITWILDNISP